jgi:hypothetical protein
MMHDITVNGRELAIEFEWASQGHRLTAMEWDGSEWQTVPDYNGVLCLMQTPFESLCNLASDLFDEAAWAEDLAAKLQIPMTFFGEED